MAFIHWEGTTPLNPYGNGESHIILAHSTLPDALILAEFIGGDPYQKSPEGLPVSDGRSLTGALRVTGGNHEPKQRWDCTHAVKPPQVNLFNALIAAQSSTTIPIVLQDNFLTPVQFPVWIDVQPQYLTPYQSLEWFILQFTALRDS